MSVTPADEDLYARIKASWDADAPVYDRRPLHGFGSRREQFAWRRVLGPTFDRLGRDKRLRIVDLGTGTGVMSTLLANMGYEVIGVDLSPAMLALAREKAARMGLPLTLLEGRADQLALPDHSVDAVFSRHLFWTLPDPKAAVREWTRVVRPGGMIAIADGWWDPPGRDWRARRAAGAALRRILEPRAAPEHAGYDELSNRLPLAGGVSPYSIRYYLDSADLVRVKVRDLQSIRRAESSSLPAWRRVDRPRYTWLATGFRQE